MKPLISIIVPVYNTELYLKHCLESIACQTFENIEVIIVDDGSTDNSPIICDDFCEEHLNFKTYHFKNSGPSNARNYGLKVANGFYVMFVDSDDWLEKNACELLYNSAIAFNSDYAIGAHVNESSNESKNRYIFNDNFFFDGESFHDNILVPTLGLVGNNIKDPSKLDRLTPVWARLYKLEIIKNNNIHFIDLQKLPSECLQFNFDYCLHISNASYIKDVVYHYRRNTGVSVTKKYRTGLIEKWQWWYEYMQVNYMHDCQDQMLIDAFYCRICCGVIPIGDNAIRKSSFKEIYNECKFFLNDELYSNSFDKFNYSYCPTYWKIFFFSAKHKLIFTFMFLIKTIETILKWRKS